MPNTNTEKACPNLDQYQQLASGLLSDIEKESILSHLESCDTCALKLKTLPEQDTLVGMLRQADTINEKTAKKAIAGLVERLSKMRPEQVPAHAKPLLTAAGAAKSDNTIDQPPADVAKKATYEFLAQAQAPDELGRLGPYRVLDVLGTGGMGVVFRAEDPQLARMVALKAMLPGSMTSESARQRFLREARAAAAIKHDHIVTIHQVGEDRGVLYLAMELLDGEPLDGRLQREGKLPVAEVLRIGRQIALALAAAHKRGLIHRDIKPANIWLEAETNRVKILDFGLARATGDQAQLTQQGAIVGTPAYMAPEQAKGKDVDHRCDLFSLGCVLYRMATGAAPFHGTDVVSTLVSVATETPRPPQVLEPRLPKALSELIVNLLAKDASDRPASAQVVVETLDQIAHEVGRPATPAKPRKWWPVGAVAATIAAILIGLWAGGIIRLRTPDGTIVIDVNEPGAEILVDGNEATVTWDKGGKRATIRIKPGTRKVEVKVMKQGFAAISEFVEIEDGGRTIFTARLHREAPSAKSADALPPRYKNTLGMEFALVPKGKSWLGGGGGKPGDKEVEFKDDFYLGVYEVTQEEWGRLMPKHRNHFSPDGDGFLAVKGISEAELKRFPAENMSWEDTRLFLAQLNARDTQDGWVYRLPTQDEWEYACRGGPIDRAESGFNYYLEQATKELLPGQANVKYEESLNRTCKVGSYKPNRLGLFDMHGNVGEWCDDSVTDNGKRQLFRGGTCLAQAFHSQAATQAQLPPTSRSSMGLGLRVARVRVAPSPQPSFAAAPFEEKQAKAFQEAWAKHLGQKVVEDNSLGMKMTLIPPGKFMMGNADTAAKVGQDFAGTDEERPAHEVEITRPFVIAATEVTQEQFEKIMGRSPSGFAATGHKQKEAAGVDTKKLPVEMVTWFDAIEFCNKLSEKEGLQPYYELKYSVRGKEGHISTADVKVLGGLGFRLPTEAEWEYACRGGTTTPFSFPFNYATNAQYGWFGYDSARSHEVGTRKPNAFGLHDMHGNVHEWCQDWHDPYTSGSQRDPAGPATGKERTTRGGAYNYLVQYARSAWRGRSAPGARHDNTGFRVVRFVAAPAIDPDRRAAEWALSVGGEIGIRQNGKERKINTERKINAGEGLPTDAFELTFVNVNNHPKVTDAGLANLRDCKNLTFLALHFCRVGDTGVAHLKNCTNLAKLSLAGTQVSDAALVHLKDHQHLESLDLNHNPKIGDPGIAELAGCSKLVSLAVLNTKVTEAGVKKLKAALPSLYIQWKSADADRRAAEWVLSIGGAVKVDDGLTLLKTKEELPREPFRLTTVDLSWNQRITDKGWTNLEGCQHITRIHLPHTPITDAGIAYFKDCKGLVHLNLVDSKVTDVGLAVFKDRPELENLHIWNNSVTDAGMEFFKDCKKLRVLDIRCPKVTDAGMAYFKGRDLVRLEFTGSAVTDRGLAYFKDCVNLTWLDVCNTQISDDGLAHFKGCKKLGTLYAFGTELTDAALVHLKDCRNLSKLELDRTRVTGSGLGNLKDCNLTLLSLTGTPFSDQHIELLGGLFRLETVRLKGTKVTQAGVKKLADLLPHCTIDWNGSVIAPTKAAADPDRRAAEWVLWLGGHVHTVPYKKGPTINKIEDLPAEPFELRVVSFDGNNPKVTDAGLANLQGCKHLTLLDLRGTSITNAGLAHLSGLANLSDLGLARTKVTDEGLVHLKNLGNLVFLNLDNTAVTGEGLVHVKDNKNLKRLQLAAAPLNDAAFAHLQEMTWLEGLQLDFTRTNNADLARLSKLTNLWNIQLEHTKIGAGALVHLKECKKLGYLGLAGTKITDADLAYVGQFKNLVWLELNDVPIGDEGLAHLKGLVKMEAMNLTGASISRAGLLHLKDFKNLVGITLSGTKIGDESIDVMANWSKMVHLRLRQTKITDAGARKLAEKLPGCRVEWDGGELQVNAPAADADRRAAEFVLSIGGAIQVNELARHIVAFAELPSRAFELTGVMLPSNKKVTDEEFTNFRGCKNLTLLNLGYTLVSDAGLANFKVARQFIGMDPPSRTCIRPIVEYN